MGTSSGTTHNTTLRRRREFWEYAVSFSVRSGASSGILRRVFPDGAWETFEERCKAQSPYGRTPGWRLASFLVKADDELRREGLAMQIVDNLRRTFDKHGVDAWLRPYGITCCGARAGLVETMSDCHSIDHIKQAMTGLDLEPDLATYFDIVYGPYDDRQPVGGTSRKEASLNFARSLAGASLFCYALDVKDRHNGNIMLDRAGRLVHIDFGYMLGRTPGGLNFEDAPFKLPDEYVRVLGCGSDAWVAFSTALGGWPARVSCGFARAANNARIILRRRALRRRRRAEARGSVCGFGRRSAADRRGRDGDDPPVAQLGAREAVRLVPVADERHRALSLFFVTVNSVMSMASSLVIGVAWRPDLSVDAGHLALHIERRPAIMAVHAADRLVERAVAVVVLAALGRRRCGSFDFQARAQSITRCTTGSPRVRIAGHHDAACRTTMESREAEQVLASSTTGRCPRSSPSDDSARRRSSRWLARVVLASCAASRRATTAWSSAGSG